jgi:PhzF family phenazine biosynthesis protein
MRIPLLQIDAFTDRSFAGNPAGVCLLQEPRDAAWMQAVAAEMNLSETAFLVPRGEAAFDLRWFTPTVEVELCGHATLASAHAIWERGIARPEKTLEFATASGRLTASLKSDAWIELDFPANPLAPIGPGSDRWPEAVALGAALGVTVSEAATKGRDWILVAGGAAEVRGARPDFGAVRKLGDMVMLTARADEGTGVDFVSRCFVPAYGIPEDPVTGSAHCALGPFWAPRLGRTEMTAHQVSARGGVVRVRIVGNRVALGGQAVTVIEGELVA